MGFEDMLLYGTCCAGVGFLTCVIYIIIENLRTTYTIIQDGVGGP
jgi:hypothetical protein